MRSSDPLSWQPQHIRRKTQSSLMSLSSRQGQEEMGNTSNKAHLRRIYQCSSSKVAPSLMKIPILSLSGARTSVEVSTLLQLESPKCRLLKAVKVSYDLTSLPLRTTLREPVNRIMGLTTSNPLLSRNRSSTSIYPCQGIPPLA